MSGAPIGPDALWDVVALSDPRWSNDASRLAWTATTLEPGADGPTPRVQVFKRATSTCSQAIPSGSSTTPRWRPFTAQLAVIAVGAGDRAGTGAPQVWLLDAASDTVGAPTQLTEIPGGIRDAAWSPDGFHLCVVALDGPRAPTATDPVELRRAPRVVRGLRTRLDGIGWTGDRRTHLHLVDVEDGGVRQLTTGDWDDADPTWSPDGGSIAFTSDRRPERIDDRYRADLWTVSAAGGEPRRLTSAAGLVVAPTWAPNGTNIAYLGTDAGEAFWTAELELRTLDPRRGTNADDAPPVHATGIHRLRGPEGRVVAWSDDASTLYVTAAVRGACHLLRIDPRETTPRQTVIGGDVRVGGFDVAADGCVVAVASWIDRPPAIIIIGSDGIEATVHAPGAKLGTAAVAALGGIHRLASTAADGTTSTSFVLVPASPGPHRLAVDLHGGPQGWHPSLSPTEWILHHSLLARGFAVLLPNPRGSSGFGADFMTACVGDWGHGPLSDVLGAVDAVMEPGAVPGLDLASGAAPVLHGYSYGGYLGAFATAHDHRFARAVIGAPIADPWSTFGTIDIPGFTVHSTGGDAGLPWQAPQLWLDQSPAWNAHGCTTPTLLVHNEGDLRCPIGQSELLFAVLRLAGCEVELVRYPGGFHGTAAPFQMVDRLRRTVEWLLRDAPRA